MAKLMIKPERLAVTSPGQSEAPPWVGEPNTLGAPKPQGVPSGGRNGLSSAPSGFCCARAPWVPGLRPGLANLRPSAYKVNNSGELRPLGSYGGRPIIRSGARRLQKETYDRKACLVFWRPRPALSSSVPLLESRPCLSQSHRTASIMQSPEYPSATRPEREP